jgi:hypothetical protein
MSKDLLTFINELEYSGREKLEGILARIQRKLAPLMQLTTAVYAIPALMSRDYVKVCGLCADQKLAIHVYREPERLSLAKWHLEKEGVRVLGTGITNNGFGYVLALEE